MQCYTERLHLGNTQSHLLKKVPLKLVCFRRVGDCCRVACLGDGRIGQHPIQLPHVTCRSPIYQPLAPFGFYSRLVRSYPLRYPPDRSSVWHGHVCIPCVQKYLQFGIDQSRIKPEAACLGEVEIHLPQHLCTLLQTFHGSV
jgi:hypothetical protein